MKILQVINSLDFGGTEKLLELKKYINKMAA